MRKSGQSLAVTLILVILAALALNLVGCARARGATSLATPPAQAVSDYTANLRFGGLTRTYTVHAPPAATSGRPLPLVLALHGRLGTGSGQAQLTHLNTVADANGFIVVYPDGYQRSWADGRGSTPADQAGVDDVGFLGAVLDQVMAREHVDATRVYVTGMSNGGFMTERLGCDLAQRFAAIAIAAATFEQSLAARCKPAHPLPVLLIHGSDDPLVPASGGVVSGVTLLSIDDTVSRWASVDGCGAVGATTTLPIVVQDGTSVQRSTYAGCHGGAQVVYYDVLGGGHSWPGGLQYLPVAVIGKTSRNLDASQVIWQFFQSYHL